MIRRLLCVLMLSTLPVVLALAAADDTDESLARELPRIPAHEPADALKTFKLHKGFHLEQIAAEPIVINPVAACYDADGRLYVVEMRDYPFTGIKPPGDVALLEDTNGDGKFDKRSVFVDGLPWPTGIVPYDGGVYITSAPDIIYAKDTDGDGKADIQRIAFTGFGTGNVQALINGLLWGPDGWIYGVAGGNGGDIKNMAKPDAKPVSVRGRDFRFRPDGSAFEATSGGGQFGHSFNDRYDRFTCNNSNSTRQIVLPAAYLERNPALAVDRVLTDIDIEGGAGKVFRISQPEPWRIVRTRQRLADPKVRDRLSFTERFAFGYFTSATGVTVYRGSAYPSEFQGNIFVGDVGGNLVHRKLVTPKGSIFEARRADENVEFLASTDNWFRPVNFTNTPDGCLLILDMYRETIEHPESIPIPIKKHLDLTSGKNRGRLYKLVPDGFVSKPKPAMSRMPTAELVKQLASPDAWMRETAQRLLLEHPSADMDEPLRQLLADRSNPLGRMHALYVLAAPGHIQPKDLIAGLKDANPLVRAAAARLAEPFVNDEYEVRAALLALANDADPMVRFQAAFSIGAIKDARAIPALAAIAKQDGDDPWTRAAVQSSIAGRASALLTALAADPAYLKSSAGRVWLDAIATLIGVENQPNAIRDLLAGQAGANADPASVRAVILGLGRGLKRAGGSLRAALDGPGGANLNTLFEHAAKTAAEPSDSPARVDAIRLLGLGATDPALNILPALLDAKEPAPVQLAALQTLADLPDRRVGLALVEHWKALGPNLRREALEALLARADRVAVLLDAIAAKTIPAAEFDPARKAQLLAHRDPAIRKRAAELLGDNARTDRGPIIAAFHNALDLTGDVTRGREAFKKACSTCHKIEDQGTEVGPNLATITNRTPEDLLIHILDPNREVQPAFLNYTVATTDGQVLSGMIAEESATTVTLKRAEGATDLIPRNRIEAMTSTGLSLMPENLETMIDKQGMADLIAYLLSIRK